ncbi:hypothetical protein GCM10018962_70780 [Dactylosporangium matsuzakiense]|uniref:Fido domain-containing protein n=1 Tax=Dactylosporangium matsuzakiense TaxID=53360 RepID=A0A9W6KII9_9ACTN|nr:hypothetical protein GCM10017581_031810 [Dactylosporangium matsuzakiense]
MAVDPMMLVRKPTWAEADPGTHPFDPATVPAVVRAVAPPELPAPGEPARAWVDTVSLGLVEHYGRWVVGWDGRRFAHAVPGGPEPRWCCAEDSITTPERTLAAIVSGVLDWRALLEEVAEHFAWHLPLPTEPRAAFAAWEAAVVDLVTITASRTGADEFWYGHSKQVLGWFLAAAGVPDTVAASMVAEATRGRFRSWTVQPVASIIDAGEALAAALTGVAPGGDEWPDTWPWDWPNRRTTQMPSAARSPGPEYARSVDSLTEWRRVRAAARWSDVAEHLDGPARTGRDGLAEHFAAREDGGDRLLAALESVRADAVAGAALTFDRLAAWQRLVLGVRAAPLRTTPAAAKGGREWYAYWPDVPEAFERCLAEAADPGVPLPSRAARVYLDVAFFHPFADGNARAAALALYFVLAREGVVLERVVPLLVVARPARDVRAAEALARTVAVLAEQTRRHAGA